MLNGQDSITLQYETSITGRSYEDEDYPMMDSIKFDLRGFYIKDREVITKTVLKRQKAKKWAIGLQAGYGYGINSEQFEPFIGIGVSYRLF